MDDNRKITLKRALSFICACVVGIGIFITCVQILQLPDKETLWARTEFFWLCVAIAAQAVQTTCVAFRWQILLSSAQVHIKPWDAWQAVSFFTFLSIILPRDFADIGARGVWLAKHAKINVAAACHLTVCDRLFELFLLLLLLPASLMYLSGAPLYMALLGVAITIIAGSVLMLIAGSHFFLLAKQFFILLRNVCSYIPFLRDRSNWTIESPDISAKNSIIIYILTVARYIAVVVYTVACFKTIGLYCAIPVLVLILPASQVALMFSFAPGGLGVIEMSWVALLKIYTTLSNVEISLYLVAQRMCVTITPFICAMPIFVLFIFAIYNKKYVNNRRII